MHQQSIDIVREIRDRYLPTKGSVLDVGSYDVNGTYRPLFAGWTYLGVDIAQGPGVDLIISTEEPWTDLGTYDLVLSGQTLEHAKRPWHLFAEMARHVRPGGHIVVVAPFVIGEHRYPIDAWRFLPDGMRVLAGDAGLEVIDTGTRGELASMLVDTYLIARRGLPNAEKAGLVFELVDGGCRETIPIIEIIDRSRRARPFRVHPAFVAPERAVGGRRLTGLRHHA